MNHKDRLNHRSSGNHPESAERSGKIILPAAPHWAHFLQRTVGNRATGEWLKSVKGERERAVHTPSNGGSPLIQRKLKQVSSDHVQTPAGAISAALGGVAVNSMELPGTQPAGQQDRPKKVEAEVTKSTLRDSDRKDSGNLSKVTTMARAEQVILQGADVKKFFDAGHLIADQLVGKKEDSFVMWNLAPQSSEFNAPAYAQVMEEEVKKAAKGGSQIKVEVEVAYPDGGTYKVKVSNILNRKIVPYTLIGTSHVKIGNQVFPASKLDEEFEIPRRIPDQWKMDASVLKGKDLAEAKKPASPGKNASKSVAETDLPGANPTIGRPYVFAVSNSNRKQDSLEMAGAPKRTLIAKQWAPMAGNVRADDVASLVSNTFPDLGNKDAIIEKLSTSGGIIELLHKAGIQVSTGLQVALHRMTDLKDTTLLKDSVVANIDKITKLLDESQKARDAQQLKEAVDFLVRAHQLVDDMNEGIAETEVEQREKYPFPLSVVDKLNKDVADFQTPGRRDAPNLMDVKRLFTGNQYENMYANDSGGEFRFFHFGPPAEIHEAIAIDNPIAKQRMVVIVVAVFQESPGLWHIRYCQPGAFGNNF